MMFFVKNSYKIYSKILKIKQTKSIICRLFHYFIIRD